MSTVWCYFTAVIGIYCLGCPMIIEDLKPVLCYFIYFVMS